MAKERFHKVVGKNDNRHYWAFIFSDGSWMIVPRDSSNENDVTKINLANYVAVNQPGEEIEKHYERIGE